MTKLTPLVLDLETFFSDTHTLKKMNPIEYTMHPDTEIQSCSFTMPGKPTKVIFGEDKIRHALASLPGDRIMAIGHNMAGFDALILAWRLNFRPAMWGCTQSMARALYTKDSPLSLDAMLKFLGAPMRKGSLEATNTKGKRLRDFTPGELDAMREYNAIDGDGCMWLFKKMARQIGMKELQLIDETIRLTIEPKLVFDRPLLERTLEEAREQTRQALLECADLLGIDWDDEATRLEEVRSQLSSAPKFSQILSERGVRVPMKVSKAALAKGEHKLIPALAKNDDGMKALLEHDDVVVASAAGARLRVKSTQLESRIKTFLDWESRLHGLAPMPLLYCGADTTGRWSGCLVSDTRVIAKEPGGAVVEKRIVDVLLDDLVWDGLEFVSHSGVVFSGYQEVITHDGVTGTPDHVVFTDVGEISLRDALSGGHAIQAAARPAEHGLDANRPNATEHKM